MSAPLVFSADGNKSVTAKFVRQYSVTATANPAGGGTISGAGISDTGKVVTLTAGPNPSYRFVGWTGSYSWTANPVEITASSDKTFTAHFEPVGP